MGIGQPFEQVGIELEAAVSLLLENVNAVNETETVSLLETSGRILAQEVKAGFDNPPFPRSPLDGYAFAASSVEQASAKQPVRLKIIATVYAGQYYAGQINQGEAVKITTGAPIPAGCDCVVRQEDVTIEADYVDIPFTMKAYQNYCYRGEDFEQEALLLTSGTRLTFVEAGILASAGLSEVLVYRKPKAALLITGDEVVMPGEPLPPGKIYGSNLHMLCCRLKELGVVVTCVKQVADDPAVMAEAVKAAALEADVVITTGGVSVGDKDIMHQVLELLKCRQIFWRILLKPGTPAMFSLYQDKPLLCLSGNPFAAATTFELLARPLLAKISRDRSFVLRESEAVLEAGFSKASKGRRFLRAAYADGRVWIPETKRHASGILASMTGCNCLIDIPAGTGALLPGSRIKIRLL